MRNSSDLTNCYIGLGSNLNNPVQQLQRACTSIANISGVDFQRCSQFIETKPVGYENQANFINAVVWIKTVLAPDVLLTELQNIENQQGRVRTIKNGPRTLDLDILLFGNLNIQTEHLIIPHPRMLEREFVMAPLREVLDASLEMSNQFLAQRMD